MKFHFNWVSSVCIGYLWQPKHKQMEVRKGVILELVETRR